MTNRTNLYKYRWNTRFRVTGTTTTSPFSIMARDGPLCKCMEQLYMDLPTPEDLSRMFAGTESDGSVSKPKPEPPCKLRSLAHQSVKPAAEPHQTSNAPNRKDRITALPTEILEQILLNVDLRTVLLTAQRVSRFFRATIQTSKLLKRHLWLETREESEKPTTVRGCRKHGIYESRLPLIPHGVCHLISYPSVRINPLLQKVLTEKPGFVRATASSNRMRKIKSLTKDLHDLGLEGQKPSDEPIHVPIKDLHIVFSTVKQITEWLAEADESSVPQIWPDMQLFTPNPFRDQEATIGYTAFEKMECPSKKSGDYTEGQWIQRVHYINAGTFDGVVTLRKLVERVKERHRDIYMQI
ncbi:hypothetical protein HII31_04745 [Pseudocercospora fuligena]|uniref:F-box domain-containing protein n=1 Tax=Pseudocercospora fuligena TaxID=685502 RepID=A0A8H6VJE4_9PEZI|nr:hypothetical protein HII31_04745 [Pseudocercospora fuligena]